MSQASGGPQLGYPFSLLNYDCQGPDAVKKALAICVHVKQYNLSTIID